jgi:SAM-dependent methyltransferase
MLLNAERRFFLHSAIISLLIIVAARPQQSIEEAVGQQDNQLLGSLGSTSPPPISGRKETSATQPIKREKKKRLRGLYGGKGDHLHLGGFTEYDIAGISNNTFNYMLSELAIKSLLDVGCGRGISTKYFLDHGARVLCVEGSNDAIKQSLLPRDLIIDHDYTKGPYWPSETFDAAWSVEFLEHISRQYIRNYLATFRRAALIFVTSSFGGGWHHIEVRESYWWNWRLIAAGFVYIADLSEAIKKSACSETMLGQHICHTMRVYINPAVASLPQHDHLFGGHGCIWGQERGVKCESGKFKWWNEGVDAVPPKYQSLLECKLNRTHRHIMEDCQPNIPAIEENKQRMVKQAGEQSSSTKKESYFEMNI